MNGVELAVALWGRTAVERALAHPAPAPLDAELRARIGEHLTTDAGLAAWGRELEEATFAAVVRLISGETRSDLLAALAAGRDGGTH